MNQHPRTTPLTRTTMRRVAWAFGSCGAGNDGTSFDEELT